MSKLRRLKPIFPAVTAHTKAGKIGNLLLNALTTSFSYSDKLGSSCLSKLCRLKPIFPAATAHTKAGKIGNLLLNVLVKTSSMREVLGIPKYQKLPVSVRVGRLPQKPPELTNARLWRREA